MTTTKKRALALMHNGYTSRAQPWRRIYPKWKQAYAIAISEEKRYATFCAARLLGTVSAGTTRILRAVRL